LQIHHCSKATFHDVDLPDTEAARKEAAFIFADLLRDVALKFNDCPEWRMEVTDEFGNSVMRLKVKAEYPT